MLKPSELIANLRHGKILPVYLFYGEEEFLIQEAVDIIIETVVDAGARDFNFNMLYCRDTSASEIVNLCQTLPFMSERRLVIAKDIDAFKAGDLEVVLPYLKDPSPGTCLVLVSNQARYDKKGVVTAVESHGAVTRFFALLDRDVVPWIEGRVRAKKMSIQRDAAQYLWQTVGSDLLKIINELEKVEIFLKERKSITLDDVKTVVGDFREYSSFDLAAAVGSKNREKALLILSRLLQEGEAPVGILGSVAWNFRRLLQAKSMEAGGESRDEIVKKLKIIFHQAPQFKEQMRSYSLEELKTVFDVLLSADKTLKSSSLSGKLVLERMIIRLCGVG